MNRLLLSIGFLCGVLFVFSQEKRFIVLDENQKGLADATVYSLSKNVSYTTNREGIALIKTDKKHSYVVFKEGYKSTEYLLVDFEKLDEYSITLKKLQQDIDEVNVNGKKNSKIDRLQLRAVENMQLFSSKKTEKIEIEKVEANLATNNNRQIFAKVAGINIWESSGSGLNTEIGGRGLSPQRSSNFNVRQNNYDISADALGYPDAYYVPPVEAVDRIEVVRGAASLQYGTQFGGMINYVMKAPSQNTTLHMRIRQTVGSYGFSNTFVQVDGTHKKVSYLGIGQFKRGNAWRDNSGYNAGFAYAKLAWQANKKLNLSASYTFYNYLAQQGGGLTDRLFEENPQQSIRDRNWFKINWHLPQAELNYKFSKKLKLQSSFFALIAQRDAVGFLGNITRTDPLEERDLLVDHYKNFGNETRLLYKYELFNQPNTFLVGTRLYRGSTQKQQGFGSKNADADFNYLNPERLEGSDYIFPSRNIALFAENIFRFSEHFSITPGIRIENIVTQADGYYRIINEDLAGNILLDTLFNEQLSKKRSFVIAGIGASYQFKNTHELYTSISQNYRAVNFNDLRILNPNARVDPNLEDEKGYNADIGLRGTHKDILAYDFSAFYLYYQNRIGFTLEFDSTLFNLYRFRTNVSASRNIGVESVIEIDYLKLSKGISNEFSLKTLFNFSYIDGRYIGSKESAFQNKNVELVPNVIFKTKLSFGWKDFSLGTQFSYLSQQFTDATNAERSSDAVNGIVPAYYVMDLYTKYSIKGFSVEGSINNLTNNAYFTRRAAGYPGPGIIPAEGITFYLTVAYDFSLKKNN